ncbi:DUF6518 family protein [Amnibacterium kyonggiense]|uniref:Uncharacterized protein n=1 Tax=Amnibacterium kyonggiense TaxID=595671 RepID=A0A4R7FSU7_9MICO|nr:DUF6518 family protein [Amnibacterium kyonggiense]TDS80952.1 hypothetical protein CLV52_1524 [Amnibacterium kyonggiense]
MTAPAITVHREPSPLGVVVRVGWFALLVVAGLAAGIEGERIIREAAASPDALAVANAGAPYAVVLAVLAMVRRSPAWAAADALGFFAAYVGGYYLAVAVHHGGAAVDRHYALVWLLVALVACPIGAAAITWARARPGVLRAVVFAVPASAALAEALTGRMWGMGDLLAPVVLTADLLVAAGYVLVLPRGLRTRIVAAVLVVPGTIGFVALTQHLTATGAFWRYVY